MLKIENPRKKFVAENLDFILKVFTLPGHILQNPFFASVLPKEIRRILVIRLDHIGDVVMSTSIYKHIKTKYPQGRITVMTGSWGKDVLRNNPYVDEIIIHDCPWWKATRKKRFNYLKWLFKEYPQVLRTIRKRRFDIGVDLRGDFRHILFFLFLGKVKHRIGYGRSGGECLLNRAVPFNISGHEIEKNFRLLEEMNIKGVSFGAKRPMIFLTDRDKKKVEELLQRPDVAGKYLKVVVHPGSVNLLRTWPEDRFAEIIDWLAKFPSGVRVFLVGSKEEVLLGEKIGRKSHFKPINLIGKLSILETAALIEKSSFFIGNDSAIAHLASSFDVPLLVLFGPNAPERCRPYSPKLSYIYHKFCCSPCLQLKCFRTKSMRSKCVEEIKVEEVKERISNVLS